MTYKRDDKEFKAYLAAKHDKIQQEKIMTEKTVLTKKAKREAKKLFPKKAHLTRPFTSQDYAALPKGGK